MESAPTDETKGSILARACARSGRKIRIVSEAVRISGFEGPPQPHFDFFAMRRLYSSRDF